MIPFDPNWTDFQLVLVPQVRKWKARMWVYHGIEFFIHPAMQASPELGFPGWSTTRRDSSGEDGTVMIKNDAQRDRTATQIDSFRQALAKLELEKPGKRSAAIQGSYESMIRQLEDEVREYDQLEKSPTSYPYPTSSG